MAAGLSLSALSPRDLLLPEAKPLYPGLVTCSSLALLLSKLWEMFAEI